MPPARPVDRYAVDAGFEEDLQVLLDGVAHAHLHADGKASPAASAGLPHPAGRRSRLPPTDDPAHSGQRKVTGVIENEGCQTQQPG